MRCHDPCDAQVHGEGLRPRDRRARLRGGLLRRLPARGYRRRRLRLRSAGHEGNINLFFTLE